MRRHPILWSLLAAYLLVVGLWPAAATPINLVVVGAFTVLLQPAVLLAVLLVAAVVSALRRPAHAHARRH